VGLEESAACTSALVAVVVTVTVAEGEALLPPELTLPIRIPASSPPTATSA
jgi:hypothetical protein